MKRCLGLLALFAIAVLLAGCAVTHLDVAVSPESGHPLPGADGLVVRFRVSGAAGEISVVFGDGETLDTKEPAFEHVYRRAGAYVWEIRSAAQRATGVVTFLNNAPKVKPPFWIEGTRVANGEFVVFDPRHLSNGCDASGEPLFEWGAWDPDGDPIEIRYLVESELGGPETVFSRNRWDITGEWIAPDFTAWFAGWTHPWARFSFVLPPRDDYFGGVALMGVCPPPPPPPPPDLPGTPHDVTFTLEARDAWGGVGAVSWVITVYSGACSE